MDGAPLRSFFDGLNDGGAFEKQRAGEIPIGHIPPDHACAQAVYFLLSDMASEITGAALDVNGGDWVANAPALAQDPKEGFDPDAVTVSETVDIAAPAAIVWQILTDLPRYGEWNPFCVHAQSTLEMGAPVHMSLVNYISPGTLLPNCEYICGFE
ncbi:hypothetical protein E4T56_gene4400, partial [Termitomyces sp. T112]